jgi:hypothetical protein
MTAPVSYELYPFVGAGPLHFGMDTQAAERAVGKPEQTTTNHLGQRVEFRGPLTLGYSDESGQSLNHIAFGPDAGALALGQARIFGEPDLEVLRHLYSMDPTCGTYLGFLVFPLLGIALTGFHDEDRAQRAASLFPRGAWDKRLPKLAAFPPR